MSSPIHARKARQNGGFHRAVLTLAFTLFGFGGLLAQPWMTAQYFNPANPDQPTLQDYRTAFDAYWQSHTPAKGKGIKPFRRWEWVTADRLGPNGTITNPTVTFHNYQQYCQQWNAANPNLPIPSPFSNDFSVPGTGNGNGNGDGTQSTSGAWVSLGSNANVPANNFTGQPTGLGRVNTVAFHPTTANTFYVGTPAGGIWKTTDGGATYTPLGDGWAAIGVSSIAIHPTTPNTLFVVTGDKDATDTPCIGVLKSTNGGTTWTTTGITFTPLTSERLAKIIIDPTTPNNMLVCGDGSIRRTTDGGNTWSTTSTAADFCDIEFKPGNSNIVYASTRNGRFYKSTNNGVTWAQITSVLPTTNAQRAELAVSAANANYVYMVISDDNAGLRGVYRSTDSGATFTLRYNGQTANQNLLGYEFDASDTGGQGWYDLDITASPTNAEEVWVGGINVWRSTNGGTAWTLRAHWVGAGGAPEVHADQHFLAYNTAQTNTLYLGHDGGLSRTTDSGTSYTDITANMAIGQIYRMGQSPTNSSVYIIGLQDNGTQNHITGGANNWRTIYGGDGVDCAIDPATSNTQYGSYVEGDFFKTTNGGTSTTTMVDQGYTGETATWVAPFAIHPTTSTTLYAGYQNLWRSTTGGTPTSSWTQVSNLAGSDNITFIAIAPSTPNTIFIARGTALMKSTNGGTNFSTVTQPSGPTAGTLKWIHIHPTDANKVWLVYSNYSATNKVFYSTNGGTSWTNITGTLPNIPANCIVYQSGSASNVLYLGMDAGVYVRDDATGNWQPFSTGLPNVIVNELEIHYGTSRIRAATYGRGLWDSDLYTATGVQVDAQFSASDTTHCLGKIITFTDLSTGSPTSWNWTFPSGTPATSTQQNPTASWSTPGTYNVKLVCSNGTSTDSTTLAITITAGQALPYVQDFETSTAGMLLSNPDADITWTIATNLTGVPLNGSRAAYINNYDYNAAGEVDLLYTPQLDLRGLTSAQMTFQHSYRLYTGNPSDTLRIWVLNNCDSLFNFVTQFVANPANAYATGDSLTLAYRNSPNSPSNWCYTAGGAACPVIDLSAFVGQANIRVAFENITAYGNDLYLDNINITGVVNNAPVASFTTSDDTICAGGSITFTSTSTGTITSRAWTFPTGSPASGTSNSHTVTFNTAGTKTITLQVTGPGGTDTEVRQVVVHPNPTVSASPTNAICTSTNGSVVLTGATGLAPYQYGINGGTLQSSGSFTGLAAGSYTSQVTDSRGCTGSGTFTIGTTNTTLTVSGTPTSPLCNGGTNGQIVVSATGGTTPYQYNLNGGIFQASNTFTGLAAGTYTVGARDANGCTGTASVTVSAPAALSVAPTPTNATCAGNNGQVVMVGTGGTGALQYSINGTNFQASNTFTGLAPGNYTATVRDANNCTATAPFTIGSPATFTVTPTPDHVSCNGGNDGGITVGVSPNAAYQYSINGTNFQASNTFTGLAAGTYTVSVRDAGNCIVTASVTITEPTAISASATGSDVTCNGANDGSIDLTASGGTGTLDFDWGGGITTEDRTNLGAGSYTVTVTDDNGCSVTVPAITLTEPTVITTSLVATDASGAGATDGSIDATVSGGTPNYTYSWDNGANTEDINNLAPGVYILTVTDDNGCEVADTATVGFAVGASEGVEAFFQLFPNPTTGLVVVRGAFSPASPAQAVVFDATGRQVARHTLTQTEQTLSLDLAPGVYEVSITHNGNTANVKLLVR